jgi:hypothetical protein
MKKLYTLAVAALFAGTSFAQVDVEIELISPVSGSSEAPGVISLEFNIVNNGPGDIVEGDTIYFGALRGADLVDSDGTINSVNGIIIPAGAGSIAAGGSIPWAAISAALGGSFDVDCSSLTSQTDVCAYLAGIGSDALTQAGDDEDPDFSNNTDCFIVDPALANIVELDFDEAVEVTFTATEIQISSELNQEVNYSVVSITGQEVASGSLTNFAAVSTEDWNRGLYIVRVEGANEATSTKVIVQ